MVHIVIITTLAPLSCGSRRIIQVDAAHWWWLRRDPPHVIVKRFGCTTIHKKRYINVSFIHSLLIFRTHAQSVNLGGRNLTEKKHGNITVAAFLCGYARQYIYIYAFSRRFYPKRLTVYPDYTFFVSMCVPWELNPQPFVLLKLRLSRQPKSRYCSTLTNHTSMESLFIQRSDDC